MEVLCIEEITLDIGSFRVEKPHVNAVECFVLILDLRIGEVIAVTMHENVHIGHFLFYKDGKQVGGCEFGTAFV